jgi:hypothetical protein
MDVWGAEAYAAANLLSPRWARRLREARSSRTELRT